MNDRRPRIGPPNCYRLKHDSKDATCRLCDWRTSCAIHIGIGVPHTDAELERIKSREVK